MTRCSPVHLAAELLGGYPRRPPIPGAHVHQSALVGSGVTVAAGEAPREQLLRGQNVGFGHPGDSFQIGVFALEFGVQTHAEVLVSPYLWRSFGVFGGRNSGEGGGVRGSGVSALWAGGSV